LKATMWLSLTLPCKLTFNFLDSHLILEIQVTTKIFPAVFGFSFLN